VAHNHKIAVFKSSTRFRATVTSQSTQANATRCGIFLKQGHGRFNPDLHLTCFDISTVALAFTVPSGRMTAVRERYRSPPMRLRYRIRPAKPYLGISQADYSAWDHQGSCN
jgi:hypothetical protein